MSPVRFRSSYFLRRAGAAIADYSIYGSVYLLYILYFGAATEDGYQLSGCAHFLALVAAWLGWLPLPEAVFGRSFGKWAFGLRMVDVTGQAAAAAQAFLRRLLDPIDLLSAFGLVGLIVAKTNPQDQRLGDLIAKTRVVDDTEKASGAAA
jgi:uncharacterized RDD family membrane protein YckC